MAPSKTSDKSLVKAERAKKALRLRKQGRSYREMGELIGVSSQMCHKYVKEYLTTLREDTLETAQEVLDIELERLDSLLAAIMPGATGGDTQSIDRVLKIMDRRAKYLGLDAVKTVKLDGNLGLHPTYDLSKLDDSELLQMKLLQEKCKGDADDE